MTLPLASATRTTFADVVIRALSRGDECPKTLSARWGVPPSSLQRWRDGEASPDVDRLALIRFNDVELREVLQWIGGPRAQIALLPRVIPMPAPARATPQMVREAETQLLKAHVTLQETVDRSLADGVIDEREADQISEQKGVIERLVGTVNDICRRVSSDRSARRC